MTRAIDTASISFGLVSVPVRIYSTAERSHEIHFHLVHADCGRRVKQRYACPKHGDVERDDLAKGYAVDRTHTIELAPSELKALDAVANDEIAIVEFVPKGTVDPIYVERTYYLAPDRGGERAYRLLHDVLDDLAVIGVAKYAARGNSYVVMLRPFEDGLAMHQLRYADEIKPWSAIGVAPGRKPHADELGLARQLVENLVHDSFDASAYSDEVKERVRKLLDDKAESGGTIEAPEAPAPHPIPDLMKALRASLDGHHRPRRAKRH